MSLSFKDFLEFMFHEKGTVKGEEKINRFIYGSTLGKMRLIGVLGAILMLVAFIASFTHKHATAEYVVSYRYLYASLFVVMIFEIILLTFVKHNFDSHHAKLVWIMPLLTLLTLGWAIVATCINAYALGFVNPMLYICVSLMVPFCVYMHPIAYVLLAGFSDVAMLCVYYNLVSAIPSPAPKTIVVATAFLIRSCLGLHLYFLQFYIRVRSMVYEEQRIEIEELNRAQNRFFSSMSHEIRTPINTIIGLNEMILREKVSDEVAEDAANVRAASNMLLHLINDILDMSKISSGQMKLTPAAYRPGDMLSEIVGMLWMRAREKGLEFHVEVAPDIPSELYGDEVRIKQILINVLNNAIKYTKKGSVTLSIQCNGITDGTADIVYSVTDTGMGIRKESMPHLFTAFKRVDEEANRFIEGTGLGLSIVKQLTELMGGTVSVNSIYTQGSTFVIAIPQKVTDYAQIGNINLEEKHKSNMSGNYNCTFEAPEARVLAVDDNESNLMVIKKLLRDTKVIVDTADSGERALEMTLENTYDVIFMDHLMPEMDGIETFRRLRNQVGGVSKESKVIALTANAGSDMRKLYSDEGFDGYIVKPVNAGELEAEVMRLLPKEKVTFTGTDSDILVNSMMWMDDRRKKRAIAITTESVADIPHKLLEKYNIAVIPHKVETKSGIFADGNEIDSDGLLDYMSDNTFVKTHAPTVKEHENFFAKALAGANNIIHLTVSTKVNHSGYENALEGAAAFDNVTVFDTRHLSSGQGILVIEACRLAAEGLSVNEIIGRLTFMRNYVHTNFITDNLDYLARQKQVGPKLAMVFKAIMCHPVLNMRNGRMSAKEFYFGVKNKAWKKYISSCLANVSDIDLSALYITYVGLTKKEIDYIVETVESKAHFENVFITKASPAIGVNCGPGTFGLLYKRKI